MTAEQQLRQSVVDVIKSWDGATKGSAVHHAIIDIYNTIKPLPRSVRMSYTMDWCAATVSADYQSVGLIDLIPAECSCGLMVQGAKDMGIWQERDDYRPKLADIIMYDWGDSVKGDNIGAPDHTGIVTATDGDKFWVMEGNMGKPSHVGTRPMTVDGRYIRGFITPDFSSKVKSLYPGEWYDAAMTWAKRNGIISNSEPDSVPTVAQVVQMLYNYNKYHLE